MKVIIITITIIGLLTVSILIAALALTYTVKTIREGEEIDE